MIDAKVENYYRNELTKKEQEILFIGLISYDHNIRRLACESVAINKSDDLIETLTILYKFNIEINNKEGFYLAELINFWSSFTIGEIKEILKVDETYLYSPVTISRNLKLADTINMIDKALSNINVDKMDFIYGVIEILKSKKEQEQENKKIYMLYKTTK